MLQRTLMSVPLTTRGATCLLAWIAMSSVTAQADAVRIVSWNAAPSLYQALDKRLSDFSTMADELERDDLPRSYRTALRSRIPPLTAS